MAKCVDAFGDASWLTEAASAVICERPSKPPYKPGQAKSASRGPNSRSSF